MKDIQIVTIEMADLVNTVLEELSEMKGSSKIKVTNLGTAKAILP